MALHIGFQILLKGVLAITAVGGAIGGTVYAFKTTSSRNEPVGLEDVLKNIDFSTADKEFLKEKAKELAEKLKLKKDLLNFLSAELEEATKERDALTKSIKEDEVKAEALEKEIADALKEKETSEQKQEELNQRKAKVDEQHKKNKQVLDAKQSIITETTKTIAAYKTQINRHSGWIKEDEAKVTALTKEIDTKQYYYDKLVGYRGCWQAGNWGCTAIGWSLNYEDRSGNAEGVTPKINTRFAELIHLKTSKANAEASISVIKQYLKNHQKELPEQQQTLTQAQQDIKPLEKTFEASKKEVDELSQSLTALDQTITKTKATIDAKTKEKEPIVEDLQTSRSSLSQKISLIEGKTLEITQNNEELGRLSALSTKLLENTKDNDEIRSLLS